jgi:endonuclease YncB( thermonuclease family)
VAATTAAFSAPGEEFTAKVVAVHDGDSLVFSREGSETGIDLYGIRCPGLDEDCGEAARELTRRLALDKELEVLILGEDKEGKLLGDMRRGSGNCLSALLVKAGYARTNPEQPAGPTLTQLERAAQREKKGVWRDKKVWEHEEQVIWGTMSPFNYGTIMVQSDLPGRFELLNGEGQRFSMADDRTSIRVPPGEYLLQSCEYRKKDADGREWRVFGGKRGQAPPVVTRGGTLSLGCGPPFRAAIQVRYTEGRLILAFDLTGRGGEHYYGVERDGRRVSPPRFEVRNSKGEKVVAGRFKYG